MSTEPKEDPAEVDTYVRYGMLAFLLTATITVVVIYCCYKSMKKRKKKRLNKELQRESEKSTESESVQNETLETEMETKEGTLQDARIFPNKSLSNLNLYDRTSFSMTMYINEPEEEIKLDNSTSSFMSNIDLQ